MGSIRSEVDGRVCTVTIENESKRNAIDFSIVEKMIATFEALEERDEWTIAVVRGAGEKAFSAGFDLTVDRSDQTTEQKRLWSQMTETIAGYSYPVIATINGDTYGGTMVIAAACDLRIGVEGARLAVTPAKIGLVYGGRPVSRIMESISQDAGDAVHRQPDRRDPRRRGRFSQLRVEREELEDRTYGMAEEIAANAPFSLRAMKEVLHAIEAKGRLSEAELKRVQRLRDQAFASEDHAEGKTAFNEGRDPQFQDR